MIRAAQVQGFALGVTSALELSEQLVTDYALDRRPLTTWQDYGDVALRLVASWPPDLAYLVLYGLRHSSRLQGRDVVPFILKAVEMMPHLNPRAF